jgi:hypothetical protein
MKELYSALFGVGLCVMMFVGVLLMGGCSQEQKDAFHVKADQVVESAQKICKVTLDYDTVITMLAHADAVALTAWSTAKVICNQIAEAKTMPTALSTCPHGVAFNVCIKLAD